MRGPGRAGASRPCGVRLLVEFEADPLAHQRADGVAVERGFEADGVVLVVVGGVTVDSAPAEMHGPGAENDFAALGRDDGVSPDDVAGLAGLARFAVDDGDECAAPSGEAGGEFDVVAEAVVAVEESDDVVLAVGVGVAEAAGEIDFEEAFSENGDGHGCLPAGCGCATARPSASARPGRSGSRMWFGGERQAMSARIRAK